LKKRDKADIIRELELSHPDIWLLVPHRDSQYLFLNLYSFESDPSTVQPGQYRFAGDKKTRRMSREEAIVWATASGLEDRVFELTDLWWNMCACQPFNLVTANIASALVGKSSYLKKIC